MLSFPIVPFTPSGFNVSGKVDGMLNVTVTFEWDPPQDKGPETIYLISIYPRPLSHPINNTVYSTSWNATIAYNLDYTAIITAVNCAGESDPFVLSGLQISKFSYCMTTYFKPILILIADCGRPIPPTNGYISNYISSRIHNTITFQCDEGYIPSIITSSTCTFGGLWIPPPEEHNCTLVTGKLFVNTIMSMHIVPMLHVIGCHSYAQYRLMHNIIAHLVTNQIHSSTIKVWYTES